MLDIFSGISIILLIVMFIGIYWWAWHPRNDESFKELSHLPLDENKRFSDDEEKGERADD